MVQPVVTFRRSISLGSYRRMKSDVVQEEVGFWKITTPLQEDFENFVLKGFTTSQIHVLCANFVKFGRSEVGEIARCLPDKKIGKCSHSRFCANRAQNLPGPAPDNVLGVPQISSKSVHFRQSYSQTRQRRSNAPQSVSNTRRSFSFFPE